MRGESDIIATSALRSPQPPPPPPPRPAPSSLKGGVSFVGQWKRRLRFGKAITTIILVVAAVRVRA